MNSLRTIACTRTSRARIGAPRPVTAYSWDQCIPRARRNSRQHTECEVDDNVVVGEVAPDVTVSVGEVRLRLTPVISVDGARAALHVARDVCRRARPKPYVPIQYQDLTQAGWCLPYLDLCARTFACIEASLDKVEAMTITVVCRVVETATRVIIDGRVAVGRNNRASSLQFNSSKMKRFASTHTQRSLLKKG